MITYWGSGRKEAFHGARCFALGCFAMAIFVSGLSALVALAQGGPKSNKSSATLVPGDYLCGDYLAALRKTRSPKQSEADDGRQLITVGKDATGISLMLIYNFHEGGDTLAMGQDGSLQAKLYGDQRITGNVIDAHHFKLIGAAKPPQIYTFVGDAERYAAEVALVGRYADDRGRTYIFGKDGWATFPDQKFRFIVGIDHVLTAYDYFWVPPAPTKKEYAFRWVAGRLQIFAVHGEFPDDVLDKQPFAVLHAVSPQ
jgi:hypothetical protein